MPWRPRRSTGQSRVARRLLLLFVACALVPLAGLAVTTIVRTTQQLEEQAGRRLQYDVKAAALDALGRIELQANTLRVIGTTLASNAGTPEWIAQRLPAMLPFEPAALTYLPADGAPVAIVGDPIIPRLSGDGRDHLQRLGALLWHSADLARDVLVVRIETGRAGLMAMPLDYAALFGLDGWDVLPPYSDLCVLDHDSRVLACSEGVSGDIRRELAGTATPEAFALSDAGGRWIARKRQVPLQASYGAEYWTVVMMRPERVVRAPLSRFLWDFWGVAVLALLVVAWLSLTQVRRQMRPLDALMHATHRFALRDFDHRVTIGSGDEFEELAAAFNHLARELKTQFGELEAFSIGTLEALARTIDAKSPWTAGHSNRVTRLAVSIAEELGLPGEEILQIRRGGLVHDIGKLATPLGILDKPTRLTPEETAILRQHPEQGVHILEPIPAFQSILPIVQQHHEQWDGGGYPRGLAGTAIARTARVVSVADVFDAMRSDRPYRRGMPVANVVAMIEAGAGRQFDPQVVAAFLRVMSRLREREQGTLEESA